MAEDENGGVLFTVTGRTESECREKIAKKYGEREVQIISTRNKLSPGVLGFFQREYVEIEFQLLSKPEEESKEESVEVSAPGGKAPGASDGGDWLDARSALLKKNPRLQSVIQMGELSAQLESFKSEMQEQMENLMHAAQGGAEPETVRKIQAILEENEFTSDYIKKICFRLKSELSLNELNDFDLAQEKVLAWISDSIKIAPAVRGKSPRIIIIIGPTGVGKTTTIAKMAANITLVYLRNKDKGAARPVIRCITCDCSRVGAMEQLKKWADILEIGIDKAAEAGDLETLCARYAENSDYILVDTGGYSPNDKEHIAKLKEMLSLKDMDEDIYLAVSAACSARNLKNIIQSYGMFNTTAMIITKCDEASGFGRIISVLDEQGQPVSWLTTGQDVGIKKHTIIKADKLWFLQNLSGFTLDKALIEEKFKAGGAS